MNNRSLSFTLFISNIFLCLQLFAQTKSTDLPEGAVSQSKNKKIIFYPRLNQNQKNNVEMQDFKLRKEYALGFFGGINLNQTSASTNGESFSLKGSSFALGGYFTGKFNKKWNYQVNLSNEPYIADGSTSNVFCGDTSTRQCYVNINFFGVTGLAVYPIQFNEKTKMRLNAGFSAMFPQTKTSNFLNLSKQSTNYALNAGLGLDLSMYEWYYIPIDIGFSYFPNPNGLNVLGSMFRVGFGFYLN